MNVQSAWEWGGGAAGNYFGGKIKKKWQSSLSDMTITLFCAGKLAFLASILSADSIVFKQAIFKARKAREHGWKGTAA